MAEGTREGCGGAGSFAGSEKSNSFLAHFSQTKKGGKAMSFRELPRYQRAMRKLKAMPAHVRAIVDATALDGAYADEDMKRRLMLMREGGKEERFEASMEQRKKESSAGLDIAKKRIDYAEDQRDTANILAAIGVPIAGVSGLLEYKRKRDMANYLKGLT